MDVERGYIVCKGKRGLVKGTTVSGERHSLSVPIRCPKGSRPHALVHSHPSGNPALSTQDRATGRQHNISRICTQTRQHGTKCHRVK